MLLIVVMIGLNIQINSIFVTTFKNLSPIFFDNIFQMGSIKLSKTKVIKTEIKI